MSRPCEGGDGRSKRARRRFYAPWRAAGAPSTTPDADVLYVTVVLTTDAPVGVPDELRRANQCNGYRWRDGGGGGSRRGSPRAPNGERQHIGA